QEIASDAVELELLPGSKRLFPLVEVIRLELQRGTALDVVEQPTAGVVDPQEPDDPLESLSGLCQQVLVAELEKPGRFERLREFAGALQGESPFEGGRDDVLGPPESLKHRQRNVAAVAHEVNVASIGKERSEHRQMVNVFRRLVSPSRHAVVQGQLSEDR